MDQPCRTEEAASLKSQFLISWLGFTYNNSVRLLLPALISSCGASLLPRGMVFIQKEVTWCLLSKLNIVCLVFLRLLLPREKGSVRGNAEATAGSKPC